MSVSPSSLTNTGQNDFITRSLLWSNMVKCSTPSSANCFYTNLCGDCSMKAATTAQVTVQDIGRLLRGQSFIFLYINTLFPHWKSCSAQTWIPKSLLKWYHHLIHLTCAIFMHPNTCYQTLNGLTAHNCYSHLYGTMQNNTNNEKMRSWILVHCCFVTGALPYNIAKSCKVMPSHKMQT